MMIQNCNVCYLDNGSRQAHNYCRMLIRNGTLRSHYVDVFETVADRYLVSKSHGRSGSCVSFSEMLVST